MGIGGRPHGNAYVLDRKQTFQLAVANIYNVLVYLVEEELNRRQFLGIVSNTIDINNNLELAHGSVSAIVCVFFNRHYKSPHMYGV